MPVFVSHLRRLSSGFGAKLPGRRPSETGKAPSNGTEAGSRASPSSAGPRLKLEPDDYAEPPPAYSFVEPEEAEDDAEHGGFPQDDEPAEPSFAQDSYTGQPNSHIPTYHPELETSAPAQPPKEMTLTWLDKPKVFPETPLSRIPAEIWMQVILYLCPSTAASLTLANRELAHRIGGPVWHTLAQPSQTAERTLFLAHMDPDLPHHVLCHTCGTYHARLTTPPCTEKLRSDYTAHPLTRCKRIQLASPVRLTLERDLPFPLAHLAMRAHRLGPAHGIPLSNLARTWTPTVSAHTSTSTWTHRTTLAIDARTGHLLLRVTSTHHPRPNLPPSEQRLVLSCRKDYTANYSTCYHEARGGALFAAARCALSHVPTDLSAGMGKSRAGGGGGGGSASQMSSQCPSCRPLRRCMLCPTEYLISVNLVEDRRLRSHPDSINSSASPRFRHALTITRWTDLGDCSSPWAREWEACSREWEYEEAESIIYEPSVAVGGERTVRRRFEAATGVRESTVPAVPLRRSSHWVSVGMYEGLKGRSGD